MMTDVNRDLVARLADLLSRVANTRLACDIHNDAAARRAFGDALMDRYTRRKKAAGDG